MRGEIVFLEGLHVDEHGAAQDRPGSTWGTVAIKVTQPDWDKPVSRSHYWVIAGWVARRHWEGLIGASAVYTSSVGYWRVWDGDRYRPVKLAYQQTFQTTTKPIPPPRTRLSTRWKSGRWEKLTSKGWRIA